MEVGESGGREWVEVGVKPPPYTHRSRRLHCTGNYQTGEISYAGFHPGRIVAVELPTRTQRRKATKDTPRFPFTLQAHLLPLNPQK